MERLRDHWCATEANWDGDTPRLQWHATLREHDALDGLVERLHPVLQRAPLAPIDPHWLHLTLHNVGVWPAGRRAELERLVAAARRRCHTLPPLRVRLRAPRVAATAIVLDVAPAEPIARLRDVLREADVEVRGPAATPAPTGPAAKPHVSLAYARCDAATTDLSEELRAAFDEPVDLEIRAIELLLLARDYTWESVARVELGG